MNSISSHPELIIDLKHDYEKVALLYALITETIKEWQETPLRCNAGRCGEYVGGAIEDLVVSAEAVGSLIVEMRPSNVLADTLENVRQELDRVNEQIAQHEATNQ